MSLNEHTLRNYKMAHKHNCYFLDLNVLQQCGAALGAGEGGGGVLAPLHQVWSVAASLYRSWSVFGFLTLCSTQ